MEPILAQKKKNIIRVFLTVFFYLWNNVLYSKILFTSRWLAEDQRVPNVGIPDVFHYPVRCCVQPAVAREMNGFPAALEGEAHFHQLLHNIFVYAGG